MSTLQHVNVGPAELDLNRPTGKCFALQELVLWQSLGECRDQHGLVSLMLIR